jgi:hypothetical protein
VKIHFSVDDVIKSLLWLQNHNAKSIFQSYTYSFAKWLYEKYGLSTTCNCLFTDGFGNLKEVSEEWKSEFEDSSPWLKFAFHGLDFEKNYYDCSYEEAAYDCSLVQQELRRICGGGVLSPWTRMHFFSGSTEAVKAWKNEGIVGLFTADDLRGSYDLESDEELSLTGQYTRDIDKMCFMKTDIRLEKCNLNSIYDILKNYRGNQMVIFTHERFINLDDIKKKLEIILQSYESVENLIC